MGRSLLIICAGLVVAFGFTIINVSGQKESMTASNVNTYYKAKVSNAAHTGVQIAIQKYNEDESNDPDNTTQEFNYTDSINGADLILSVKESVETIAGENTEIVEISSRSEFNGVEETVIAIFDISKQQQLVPEFQGALSKVGDQNIEFDKGNHKVHFDGTPPPGSPCEAKPGLTVNNQQEVDKFDDIENIDGNPPVAVNNNITVEEVTDLIEQLEPFATIIDDRFDWETSTADNPGVYFLEEDAHFSGKDEGYGILVVKNNATLRVDNELTVTGKFKFHGLVIFANGSDFRGSGNALFDGSVISVSEGHTTFDISANGNFTAQYNCLAKKYADMAVNRALNTTIYKPLSVYEL